MSSHQYVYVMHRLSKAWPGGKEVLKNISLSFLPGAKIGVLGLNGAGKSTLLKIMAGLDTEFNGTGGQLLSIALVRQDGAHRWCGPKRRGEVCPEIQHCNSSPRA